MIGEETQQRSWSSDNRKYDPFARGQFPVGVCSFEARDAVRNRAFPIEVWYPAQQRYAGQDLAPESQDSFLPRGSDKLKHQAAVRDASAVPGTYPLILYSHHSGGERRRASFLCTHLASHGYVVAALDHSEVIAPELARQPGETEAQKLKRWDAVIGSRVPDTQFLLSQILAQKAVPTGITVDDTRIGIAGHSFGAWTALAFPDFEPRIRAVVAHAPGGTSNPRPGILPVKLAFRWGRDVPALYLVAENDASLPLAGMYETFERTPSAKRMFVLRRADHLHFIDNIEETHEQARQMPWPAELKWIQDEMRPILELCSGEKAQLFLRGLTLAHFDAVLNGNQQAQQFLRSDVHSEMLHRGIEAFEHHASKAA